jgi:hypothetical protein
VSAYQLLEQVQAMVQQGGPFDFKAMRDRIHEEADRTTSAHERVILLKIFNASADNVERELARQDDAAALTEFRKVREADYRFLIVKECLVGENICSDTLLDVTSREIAAGRMTAEHALRTLARNRVAEPHPSRDELVAMMDQPAKPKGFLGRLFCRS